MNRILLALTLLWTGLSSTHADLATQWTFNSLVPDSTSATGSTLPSAGIGSATAFGGVTTSYGSGSTADPETGDDSSWVTQDYPGTLLANKTAGVRFRADTTGYEAIQISWSQQNSGSASRYARLQFTVDGSNYVDFAVITVTNTSYTNVAFSLAGVPGANHNPLFGFQVVTEFASTAAGGLPGYIATTDTSDYSRSGTMKFDMVTVSGLPVEDGNTRPYIFGQFPDQVIGSRGSSPVLAFTVLDAEEAATNLVVEPKSSSAAVLPVGNIAVGGRAANRTVCVQGGGVAGASRVSLVVRDSGGKTNIASFNVTVLPANSAPRISGLGVAHAVAGEPVPPVCFVVEDAETPAEELGLSAESLSPGLVPQSGLGFGGAGTNRCLSVSPAAGQCGVAPIRITVSDGENSVSAAFPLMVLPGPGLVFYDGFDYAAGALTTNSAFLWSHRAGTYGDLVASNGVARLSDQWTEDAGAQLIGAPYETGKGAVLYAAFTLAVHALPKALPDCFAHFLIGNTTAGRLSLGTSNAVEGCYRLYAANGSSAEPVCYPMSMDLKVVYRVVMRYEVDAARTTLWVNPASEDSPHVTAMDAQTPGKVSTFGLRQSTGIGGDLRMDDLRIGLGFAAATGGAAPAPVLDYTVNSGRLYLSWDGPDEWLQGAGLPTGPFTNVTGATSPYELTPASEGQGFFRLGVGTRDEGRRTRKPETELD